MMERITGLEIGVLMGREKEMEREREKDTLDLVCQKSKISSELIEELAEQFSSREFLLQVPISQRHTGGCLDPLPCYSLFPGNFPLASAGFVSRTWCAMEFKKTRDPS
jgi:hypothetical protein